ncbi:MAG: hypothetical protein MUC59_16380 [Saprospiraceae bacterium]|jgi:hypothetical protein|nr:hypothetical protein [Saprospiraceae bacterium]
MKRLIKISSFACLFLMTIALGCSNANAEKENALRDEVFVIHDEVMPRMSEIVTMKGKLKDFQMDSTLSIEANALTVRLEKAEEGMMDWMNKFTQVEKLRESKNHEEIMAYLEAEKQRISKVSDDMNSSIEAAERFLASAKAQ